MCKYTKSKGEFLKNDSNIVIVDNLLSSRGVLNVIGFQ